MSFINIPNDSWKAPVDLLSDLPSGNNDIGDARIVTATNTIYIWDGVSWIASGGGGGGAVDSVNGQTGVVVLTADDVNAFALGGNTEGGNLTLGSLDNFALNLVTNNTTKLVLDGGTSAVLHVPDSTSTTPVGFVLAGGANTGGIGGSLQLRAGSTVSASAGAATTINSGANTGSGNAGLMTVAGGQSTGAGAGGELRLIGGRASGGGTPGNITLRTGTGVSGTTRATFIGTGGLQLSTPTTMMAANALTLNNSVDTFGVSLGVNASLGANYSILFPAAAPGTDTYLKYNGANYTWTTIAGGGDILNGGNAGAITIGSTDNTLSLLSNNVARMQIGTQGALTYTAGDDVGSVPNPIELYSGNGTTGGIGANVLIKAGNGDSNSGNITLEVSDQSSFFGNDGKVRFVSASTEVGYFDANGLWISNPTSGGIRLLNAAGTFSQGFRGDPSNVIASNLLWGLPLVIGSANQVLSRTGVSDTTWTTLTSSSVGLGNVDNTSDANKPISASTQIALNLKLQADILFGSGADGALSISAGTATLDRDRYYSSITITGTAKLSTAGFRVFCSGTLDLSAAPAGAIEDITTSGSNAVATAAGGQAGALTAAELGRGNRGVIGVAGGTAAGATGTAGGATAVALCQVPAGQGGAGGLGASGAGGARGTAPSITARKVAYRWEPNLIRGVTLASGATNGSAGGSGGGDTTAGGGSGASGSGGGVVYIAAKTISRGGSTAAGAIRCIGGNGGNGGVPAGGNRGGGGGGAGGTGGYIQLIYGELTGSTATDMIQASGGSGGAGGNATGTGVGGNGGDGGPGGVIVLINATASTVTTTLGTALVAGNLASGTTGGASAAGQVTQVSL